MDFTPITTNPGYGGAIFATDSFIQGSTTFVMPFTALAISSDGGVTYTPIGESGIYLPVITPRSATRTLTNISADSVSSVTLLSENAYRLGASIYNDSSAYLYIKAGTTASATSYTIKMSPNTYYELPYNDTGRYDAIWSATNGSARITEWEA